MHFELERMLVLVKQFPQNLTFLKFILSYIIMAKYFGNKYRLLLIYSPVSLYQICYNVNNC